MIELGSVVPDELIKQEDKRAKLKNLSNSNTKPTAPKI